MKINVMSVKGLQSMANQNSVLTFMQCFAGLIEVTIDHQWVPAAERNRLKNLYYRLAHILNINGRDTLQEPCNTVIANWNSFSARFDSFTKMIGNEILQIEENNRVKYHFAMKKYRNGLREAEPLYSLHEPEDVLFNPNQ